MSITPHEPAGSAVSRPMDDEYSGLGLEDIVPSDLVIPRLSIVHDGARFKDNLSKEEFGSLRVILLGLVKQRIMWAEEVDDKDKPMCKSPDHVNGYPNMSEDTPRDKRFPWAKSNFQMADFLPASGSETGIVLPCESCILKEWDQPDWKQPLCSEQHTYPLLYSPTDDGEQDTDSITDWQPAIYTVQRTGIKPSKNYVSAFAGSRTPLFTVITEISLTQLSRGSVRYSVPEFKKVGTSDRGGWSNFANTFMSIREFLKQPPRTSDDSDAIVIHPDAETVPTAATGTVHAAPAASPSSGASPTTGNGATTNPVQTAVPSTVGASASASASPSESESDLPF